MCYMIHDNLNLMGKIEKYCKNTTESDSLFLIRATQGHNDDIHFLETTCINKFVSFAKNQSIRVNQDIMRVNLKDFTENGNIFVAVHVYKTYVNMKPYNMPLSDFTFMYKMMKLGQTVKYTNPYIMIVVDSSSTKVEVYYKDKIYKDITIVRSENNDDLAVNDKKETLDSRYKFLV